MQGSFSQAGFYYQNVIAAQKVLELLEFGSPIISISLENYDKGKHIDDIIIELAKGSKYYQVKWSFDDNSSYTIHNLITPKKEKSKALIQELAEGYSSVKNKSNIEIILFSTKNISNRKNPKENINKSLAEFINQIHTPFIESDKYTEISEVPNFSEFEEILEKTRSSSGLNSNDFNKFFEVLRFELNQPNKEQQKEKTLYKLDQLGIDRKLYETLLVAVVEWSISGESIKAKDVLEKLGLTNRFLDSITHNFKVEKEYFVGNSELFSKIDDAIENLPGGFILLEGPPGSGKSTYLTEYQERSSDVKFSYYCFIPDEIELGNRRLERDSFLKSFCIGIKNSFPEIDFPNLYSQDYESKLMKWLNIISEEDSITVFIIDGLDHVDKKKNSLKHPITNYLDGNLPPNVYFVLSSQYSEALSEGIQIQIQNDPRRHIKVDRFSENETREFLELRGFDTTPDILTLIHKKSEGIPLYLHYIITLLLDLPVNDYGYEQFLSELPYLENSKIDTYHEFLYKQVKKNKNAIWILSILANRQEYTSSETLLEILQILNARCDLVELEEVLSDYKHLLRFTDARGFTIFHNSFREFILKKQTNLTKKINEAIIEFYKRNPNSDETYRNYYRHLFELERYQEILDNCNDQWLKRSWKSFRPFEEVTYNLDLAWEASAKLFSFREFIRIAFLQQEFGIVSFNIDNTENYNPSEFLLSISKDEEAVRKIWDGEQIKVEATEFYEFVIAYFEKYKKRLPKRISEIGFKQFDKKSGVKRSIAQYKARSLYEDWRELFKEIDELRWHSKNEHTYEVVLAPLEENNFRNDKIRKLVIDALFVSGEFLSLCDISEYLDCSSKTRNYARLRAIEFLIENQNKIEDKSLIENLDLNKIEQEDYNRFVIKLAEFESYDELRKYLKRTYASPLLFKGLIKKEPDFNVKEKLLKLYDNLRVYFLQNPQEINSYKIKAQSFNELEKAFFLSIIDLAELWIKSINNKITDKEKCKGVKEVLLRINVDADVRKQVFKEVVYSGEFYLSNEIHKIHFDIFAYLVKHLNNSSILDIVSYWLKLDKGKDSYQNLKSSLGFARLLSKKDKDTFSSSIQRLLKRSEFLARQDEETLSIIENLVACAKAYGYCGYNEDVNRLWNDIYSLACGVHNRKDYQFSEAIYILNNAHKTNPEKSLNRLIDLLNLANQIKGVADDRAVARAIGNLVDFSAEISPALAVEFLGRENWIYRNEVIKLFSESFPNLPNIDLRYLWAIVKTMPKWDNFNSYDDFTNPTMKNVFDASIENENLDLAEEIYTFTRKQLFVEKEMPENIYEFAEIAVSKGVNINNATEDYRNFKEEWEEKLRKKNQSQSSSFYEKPSVKMDLTNIDELHKMAEENFEDFQNWLKNISDKFWIKSTKRNLKSEFSNLREALERFLLQNREIERKSDFLYLRKFNLFQRNILRLDYVDKHKFRREIEKLFNELISGILDINKEEWKQEISQVFDYKQWLKRFTTSIDSPDYKFERRVIDKYIPQLVELSTPKNLKNWKFVCEQYVDTYKLRDNLFLIAKKSVPFDREYSKELLYEIWESNKNFFYTSTLEDIDSYLSLLFELDPERTKKMILESFITQYKNYPGQIIHNLDKVLEYSEHFNETDIYEFSYQQYLKYNEKLTKGLSEKETDYIWIESFPLDQTFGSAVIRYLLCLFDYPEVEIRKLALAALFELIKSNNSILEELIEFSVSENENTKEHLLSLLYSVALFDYELILPFKERLFLLAENTHFNISQSVKEILSYCVDKGAELTPSEQRELDSINTEPIIALPLLEEGLLYSGKKFVPNSYQTEILRHLQIENIGDSDIPKIVYSKLLQYGWTTERGMDEEGLTHRSHNKNTNFDNIEINGPYFKVIQKLLNEVFKRDIQNQKYEDISIQKLKQLFRLYDPSDLFIQKIQKPSYLNWLGKDQTDEQFLSFDDVKEYMANYRNREADWITLYEDGHQRVGDKYANKFKRTVYFNITTFLMDKSFLKNLPAIELKELEESFTSIYPVTYQPLVNIYKNELPSLLINGSSYPYDEIVPILGVSENKFRGQEELSSAALLPNIVNDLDITLEDNYSLNYLKENIEVVNFSEWQEEFDQDRRRQKPKSAGVLLKIKRETLNQYLTKNNLLVCYVVKLKRTTDIYVRENEMTWDSWNSVIL